MHFSLAITTCLASMALAAPTVARAEAKSMMAAADEWTIESLKRTLNSDDSLATWEFSIDTHSGEPTPCTFTVTGHPASQTGLATPATCGQFQVTTGWSDQFGADNGFTTLSVVNTASKLIVWPSYTDAQLANGAVVTPDQSYTPANLP